MQPHANRFAFSQALAGFLLAKAAEGRSPKTLADYRYSLGLLAGWLLATGHADPPLEDLDTETLRHFLAELHQRNPPLSAKTIKNVHTAMSSLWGWLASELGAPNIVKPIAAPKAHPPAMRLPTREQVAALLKACDHTAEARTRGRRGFAMKRPTALRDRCIVLTLLDTGLRAAELCGLALGDVDLETGSVLVRRGKGDKQRIVYLGKTTRRLLWRHLATERKDARPGDPLFLTTKGRPLTADHLSHLVADLGERAGFKVWPHLLRHVFATEFLRGGGSTLALRRLLGHVSDAMLARYVELAECDLQQAHANASPADRWRL